MSAFWPIAGPTASVVGKKSLASTILSPTSNKVDGDLVEVSLEVDDGICATGEINEDEPITAQSAGHSVGASKTGKDVVGVVADENIAKAVASRPDKSVPVDVGFRRYF